VSLSFWIEQTDCSCFDDESKAIVRCKDIQSFLDEVELVFEERTPHFLGKFDFLIDNLFSD